MPGLPIHYQLPESTQTHVHRVGDAIQPSHPLSSPSPPALNLSQNQGFSNESALRMRWPKCWSFSFNISSSNEHPELISFRMDWLDLFVVQGNLKSLLQHHSSEASILWCSAFFRVQLSHPYMTTGKTIALTRQTFVDKVISLLFNMLSAAAAAKSFQSCPTMCDPMNCSTPGLPVHHELLEFTQTHVHRVGDAIQPSHPLLSPSLPDPNPSQHQGSFPISQLFT